jgi:hypothetical protein
VPRRDVLLSLAVGVVTSVLAWVRLDGRTRGAVWAEDGVFLEDRLASGPLLSVVDPYQGYLHLVPRAVVEVAVLVPRADYAVAVTALCCVVAGAVAALVHACSRDVLGSQVARVAVALLTVIVPTLSAEALGNTANLHWFLLWLTPWVLLCRPTSDRQGWALGAVALVIGLTEIQAALFAPLLVVVLGDRRRWPVACGLLAGVAAQAVVLAVAGRQAGEIDSGTPTLLDLVQGYGIHVFLQLFHPATGGVGDVLVERGWSLVVLASAPFLLVLVALVVTSRSRDDVVVTLALGAGAVVPYVAGMLLNFRDFLAFSTFDLETLAVFAPLRYALVPAMFVLAAAVVVADRLLRRPGAVRAVAAGALLAGVVGLGLWHLDAGPTNRSDAPRWAEAVAAAEEECRGAGPDASVALGAAPEGWVVRLDCADITDG